jgi:hypothetical protein
MSQYNAMLNIVTFCSYTNELNSMCQSVGIPFYNEEWVYNDWICMTRLTIWKSVPAKPLYDSVADESIQSLMNMFLKVDMMQLSSSCKIEILRVLGEALEGMN